MSFEQPKLPYALDALGPFLSQEQMMYHYEKHQAAYFKKLNALVENKPEASLPLRSVIVQSTGPVFNNAAQAWNHTFFWNTLAAKSGGAPSGKLGEAIAASFGSFADFQAKFEAAGIGRFGSGWAWLVSNGGKLEIVSTANQDNPLMGKAIAGVEGKPLLGVDVWEHAYYLKYQNKRADYLKAVWNVINWSAVAARL